MFRIVVFFVLFLVQTSFCGPQISEIIWQTISNGNELQKDCLRPAAINQLKSWPRKASGILGINSRQKQQLAYDVLTNTFGTAYVSQGRTCARFQRRQTCDRFRVLALPFIGAEEEFDCVSKAVVDQRPQDLTPIAYHGISAVVLENNLIGNYGPVCDDGEICALFHDLDGNQISLKGNSAIENSVCFIVRKS
uniref:Uncharacterized protein n=1 Tax=Panagrolaimus sp. JU765 TaxID=591449 RepID=A0AC34QYP6_9BILA